MMYRRQMATTLVKPDVDEIGRLTNSTYRGCRPQFFRRGGVNFVRGVFGERPVSIAETGIEPDVIPNRLRTGAPNRLRSWLDRYY